MKKKIKIDDKFIREAFDRCVAANERSLDPKVFCEKNNGEHTWTETFDIRDEVFVDVYYTDGRSYSDSGYDEQRHISLEYQLNPKDGDYMADKYKAKGGPSVIIEYIWTGYRYGWCLYNSWFNGNDEEYLTEIAPLTYWELHFLDEYLKNADKYGRLRWPKKK